MNAVNTAQANFDFDEVEIDKNQIIAMAIPMNELEKQSAYKLMILERRSEANSCWNETEIGLYPILISPLGINYNFSDICKLITDNNGDYLRVDNHELSESYKLNLQNVDGDIHLVGISQSGDKTLIGRTRGIANGMMKILLEPGWQFNKRSYQGRVLDRLYFSYHSFAAKQAAVEQKIAEIDAKIPDSLDID